MQRLPKLRGFNSHRPKTDTVYTFQLEQFANKTADNASLAAAGVVESAHSKIKLVVKGELTKKVTVKLQGASATAIAAVTKAGGTFEVVPQVGRPAKAKTSKQ